MTTHAGTVQARRLRGAWLAFGLGLGVSAAVLGGLWFDQSRLDHQMLQAQSRLEQARAAYARALESSRLAVRYRDDYRRLRAARYFIGPDRLALVELFNSLRKEMSLPYLGFSFRPREPLEAYQGLHLSDYRLQGSVQKIEFSLHHEGELDRILERLRRSGQGPFVVERCTLHRTGKTLYLGDKGNVQGECRLHWLVLVSRQEVSDEAG